MGNAAWAENVKCINLNVGLHKSGFLNSNQVKSNHMFLKKIQVKSNQVKTSLKFPKSSQVKSLDFEKKVKSSQVKSESGVIASRQCRLRD